MDRKGFGAVLDETVSKMESDVRILKNQQATITINLKDLESKRDKLSQEILDLTEKHKKIIALYKAEVDVMMKTAIDKLNQATEKDGVAAAKVSELKDKVKEADNLIQSNKNLQNNLNIQLADVKAKVGKLSDLAKSIENTIADL